MRDSEGDWEARKGALESKGLGLDVKKTEIMISSENARLVKVEGTFPCTV